LTPVSTSVVLSSNVSPTA